MSGALDRYIGAGGVRCPRCNSGDIEGKEIETDIGTAWQNCRCVFCGLEWRDIYKLIGVQLEVPETLNSDGEFAEDFVCVLYEDDGSVTFFQGCGGDYDSCEEHWLVVSLEQEDEADVVYFRAYDGDGRRGNVLVPIADAKFWGDLHAVHENGGVKAEREDDYGSIVITAMETLRISTGPHGEFEMPFGDGEIAVLLNLIERKR